MPAPNGLQIAVTAMSGVAQYPLEIYQSSYAEGATVDVSNCIIKGSNDATEGRYQMGIKSHVTILNVWNCLLYNINTHCQIVLLD